MVYDPSTFSNVTEVRTTHIDVNFNVNFETRIIDGNITLKLITLVDDVKKVILDTRYLNVRSASLSGEKLKYNVAPRNEKFGSALHIELGKSLPANTEFSLNVDYTTSEQGTAIHARSLLPCQDTPAIKLTYSAEVEVPQPLRALMSAIRIDEGENTERGTRIYKFEQNTKIPSYLIALAVGNLVGKEIGPRSTVWTEPEVVDDAAWEFADTEKFIATGEELLTPYEWKRYDVLVLPSSFPYGGMENPCLTFVTPTLLAGDRSLVDVVAHEISHSWMGNLVTTTNWEHFWLNEGWTVFIERKIAGRLHGEKESEFDAIIGLQSLERDVKLFGETNALTALVPNLQGVDPDDSFSSVPYGILCYLNRYRMKVIGGPEYFEPYMKAHVQEFAGKSITTDDWKNFLYSFVEKNFGTEKKASLDTIQWESWLHSPGMPPVKNEFDQTLAKACDNLAQRWNSARNNENFDEFSPADIENFTPGQKSKTSLP
ncbi:3174_t:CDS:2 [Acaulospora colombiana]|uniref:3174_t:CDS:1 n=1 Tax=Acaulospora colombiana TaxID=27376 RepID=A0ACA9LXA7_9GLOM|nr:3174_t:CDS:2 [Acaulospora colombiana]